MAERLLDAEQRVATLQFEKDSMLLTNVDIDPLRQHIKGIDDALDSVERDIQQYQGVLEEMEVQQKRIPVASDKAQQDST
eukprot:10553547-Lingulodinium_polyedra.AAC.1